MKPSEQERALAALLRSGRADPSGDDLKRLERRLSPWLGPAPSAGYDGGRGATWKSIVFLAALGLFAPSDGMREAPATAGAPSAPVAVAASPVAVAVAAEVREVPAPGAGATVSVSDLPNAPVAAVARSAPATPRSSAPVAALAETVTAPAESSANEAGDTREPGESEASFLRRARTVLNTDPSAALRMLGEHPARFPRGTLVQERDVMTIDALARLGRIDDARAQARAFAARYPHSAHESRIASILKEGTP